ncbi:hypothetical protein B0A50_06506 [Salinomyces thailandicus]|uniref:Palmitoyltransferase n=1 Tax=Salinomyces thailandicus TaxID=706561 RepID=A0A4U0TNU5_9PEZI|nr:hypothetical protein B0A50_06506 [Salinomyces thailandica]
MAGVNDNDHDRTLSESTTFPTSTFLDTDPFPSTAPDGRPASSSSAVTDGTSEYEGETSRDLRGYGQSQGPRRGRQGGGATVSGATGPVGEPGLPPSRPASVNTSTLTSQTSARGGWRGSAGMAPPSSRRGLANALAARSAGPGAKSGAGGAKSSIEPGTEQVAHPRPTSSVSRTHVPTLAAGQGFFRPMSSQKLQAQRGQSTMPPTSSLAQNVQTAPSRASVDSEGRRHRYSNASVHTLRDGGGRPGGEEVPPLPTSRGTIFTERDGTQGDAAQGGMTGSVASGGSTVPLHSRAGGVPPRLNTTNVETSNKHSNRDPAIPAPMSPGNLSLRASFGLGSKRASSHRRPSPAQHEQLHSNPSSPTDGGNEKPSSFTPVHAPMPRGKGKNKDYYAGNTLFFLSGRLLNTKAKPLNLATFIFTALPAALFFGFSAPWLWHNVSPAMPIIFAYVFLICVSSFWHAAFSDPGILPRNLHPHPPNAEEDRDPLTVGPPTTEWIMVKTHPSKRPSKANADPEAGPTSRPTTAMEVPTKYCKSCEIWRPPRAHHCRVCDACIETQDHHCVWLNNCVGRRNYRYFFAYVASATLLALLLLAFAVVHVALYGQQNGISFSASLSGRTQERMAFALFIYATLALPYPASLAAYHIFLIARGETTREYLNSHKFLPKDRHRPFSQAGIMRNFFAVLARPRPPSYMQFKLAYQRGDVRMGYLEDKEERREGMKGRFSVVKDGQEGGEKRGVEMQALSPSEGGRARSRGVVSGGAGSSGLGDGGMNNTPR